MAGRAGYHTVGKIKKLQSEHKGNCSIFLVHCKTYQPLSYIAAFDNVFEKFDLSGDGTISIEEYKTLCEEYGVNLTQEDIAAVRRITDDGGEVRENVGSLLSF